MNDRILDHYLEEFQLGSDIVADEAGILFYCLIGSGRQSLYVEVLSAWTKEGNAEEEIFEVVSRGSIAQME